MISIFYLLRFLFFLYFRQQLGNSTDMSFQLGDVDIFLAAGFSVFVIFDFSHIKINLKLVKLLTILIPFFILFPGWILVFAEYILGTSTNFISSFIGLIAIYFMVYSLAISIYIPFFLINSSNKVSNLYFYTVLLFIFGIASLLPALRYISLLLRAVPYIYSDIFLTNKASLPVLNKQRNKK
jgi:hypothetical protein